MNFLTLPVENGCIRLGALTIVSPAATGGQIVLGIRPEDLAPVDAAEGFPFMLRVAEPLGSHIMLTGETGGQHVRVVVPPETPVHIGVMMYLNPRRDRIVWMDPASGTAVGMDNSPLWDDALVAVEPGVQARLFRRYSVRSPYRKLLSYVTR